MAYISNEDPTELKAEIARLRDAIRAHRDIKGHHRCWLDDFTLYKLLPEPLPIDCGKLPKPEEFLRECLNYCYHRANGYSANTALIEGVYRQFDIGQNVRVLESQRVGRIIGWVIEQAEGELTHSIRYRLQYHDTGLWQYLHEKDLEIA